MIVFQIKDKDTEQPLSGIIRWKEYQTIYDIPFIEGRAEIISQGTFKGAYRSFTIMSEGYVDHSDFMILHDGVTYDWGLAKFDWYTPPLEPSEPEKPSLNPLIILGGIGLLLAS